MYPEGLLDSRRRFGLRIMATSLPPVVVCVGCGEIARKNNRRILGERGSVSGEVTLLWGNTIQKELECRKLHLDVDGLVSSGLAYMYTHVATRSF